MNSSKKLASAILFQALADGQKGSQEALAWIQEGGPGFRFWRGVFGVEPNLAHACLKKSLRTAPVTRRRRRELVIQALTEHPEWSNREIGRRLGCSNSTVGGVRKRIPQALAR